MTNQRNVRALADAIYAYVQSEGYPDLGQHDEPGEGGQLDQFAEYLAARGVLVPSALTDDEAASLDGEWDTTEEITRKRAARCLAVLERLAKGLDEGIAARADAVLERLAKGDTGDSPTA